jgi:hypothetical protein
MKEGFQNLKIRIDKEYGSVIHAEMVMDESFITGIASAILNKIWIFQISETQPFYTSDNPIAFKSHLKGGSPAIDEFSTTGIQIVFPIANNICLCLLDKLHFRSRGFDDNKFNIIGAKETSRYNIFQYCHAKRQIYCQTNDFKLIEFIEKEI